MAKRIMILIAAVAMLGTAPAALAQTHGGHGGYHGGGYHGGVRVGGFVGIGPWLGYGYYPYGFGFDGYDYAYYGYPPYYVYPQPAQYPVAAAAPGQPAATGGQPALDRSYCRQFELSAKIEGTNQPVQGIACRQPDGAWHIVP